MQEVIAYAWERLPLLLLFLSGYVVYRLLVVSDLTGALVRGMLRRSRGRLRRTLLYVLGTSALLSFFIPNAVTVLALLPIVVGLERELSAVGDEERPVWLRTALMLALIYGANIGGMGSLVGSPANLLLIGWLDTLAVPGREQVTYGSWFLWSIPLVTVFGLAAWGVIVLLGLPRGARLRGRLAVDVPARLSLDRPQRLGAALFLTYVGFWIAESAARGRWPDAATGLGVTAAVFSLLFLLACFVWPSVKEPSGARRPLLRLRDLVVGVPRRGFLFLGALVAVLLTVRVLGLDSVVAGRLEALLQVDIPPFLLFFGLTLGVILLTEVLSNTIVSSAFFPIAFALAKSSGVEPLGLMLAVSLASTCAFMTPIATPCNALAYGEMRGASLRTMLRLGLVLNLIGALLMTSWLLVVIPWIYGI